MIKPWHKLSAAFTIIIGHRHRCPLAVSHPLSLFSTKFL
nr:MAG TPA: hypothetical protein [Caudoviricetes sp.]